MGENAYPDSSFLVSLHRADAHQSGARLFLVRSAHFLVYTPLHRIEVRNALRNARARGEMTRTDCQRAFEQIDEDLREGTLLHAAAEWTRIFRKADELSEEHAAKEGQRTIDLLHVAAALELKLGIFLSFDKRQRKLAGAVGLRVQP